jgi:hypothetical protein
MNTRAPEVHTYRGYDAGSATLLIAYAEGTCLGEFAPHGAWLVFDTKVAPRSGELAAILMQSPGRPTISTTKQLELIDGRWFMVSLDGLSELPPNFEVLGKVVQVVIFAHCPVIDPAQPHVVKDSTPAYRDYQARLLTQVMPRLNRRTDRRTEYPLSRRDPTAQ